MRGVGHLAVQLARHRGAEPIDAGDGPAELVFDTAGGSLFAAAQGERRVSVAEEADDATYFVVEPKRGQLVELADLVDGGALRPAIDSTFPLADARSAFERTMQRGKQGKVVLRIAD